MLTIIVPGGRQWDPVNRVFVYPKDVTLRLEHSLVSISKWEEKWHKPYLHTKDKTNEEVLHYIKCMTITQNVPDEVYERLTVKNIEQIEEYINDPMTATSFRENNEQNNRIRGEIVTSEIIYFWMIHFQIPPEYRKWHINKLITLIKVCIKKNEPPKKMSLEERRALNAARRKKLNTRG